MKQFPTRYVSMYSKCLGHFKKQKQKKKHAQVNYLIDEGMNIGKGGNCVISLLHHFLEEHNFKEVHLRLHADNCCGQVSVYIIPL